MNEELRRVCRGLKGGGLALRDRALILLGCKSGFRLREMLSLKLKQVVEVVPGPRGRPWTRIVGRIIVERRYMKRTAKVSSRSVWVHEDARAALAEWVDELSRRGYRLPEDYLFQSSDSGRNKAVTTRQALRRLKDAFARANLTGPLGSHSLRKTFAKAMYGALKGDLVKTAAVLGHANVQSTMAYLSFREATLQRAVLGTPRILSGARRRRKPRKGSLS
jgi:integrase